MRFSFLSSTFSYRICSFAFTTREEFKKKRIKQLQNFGTINGLHIKVNGNYSKDSTANLSDFMSLYKSKFTVRLPKHCKTFMLEMHSIIIVNFTTIIHLDSNMLADIWLRIFFLIGHFRPVCFLSLTFYSHTHKCNVYFLFVFFRKQKRNHMQNQFRNFSQANLSK